jgi:quercetin dioxygenase-like cupin family protein
MSLKTLPSTAGGGLGFTLIQLEPCGMNPPHTHPRASEAIYIINGENVQIGFIAENGMH